MTIFLYTFRTFPHRQFLESVPKTFIFNKLKQDSITICSQIRASQPDIVLGFASKDCSPSQFEKLAVNRFHGHKKISSTGPDNFLLHIPPELPANFVISNKTSHSFCNWTMYMIANYLFQNNLKTKLMFTHVDKDDLSGLQRWVNQ